MNFDIAIIGGGPAGYTAAERAGANGLKAVLFEKKAMGGVCLNEGCIPTKTLLYSAKILDSIKSASKYGVSAESPSFDWFFVKFGGNLFFISTVFFFLNPIKSCRYVCFLVTLKTPHH